MLLAGAALPASAFAQCVTNAPSVDACLGGVRQTTPSASLDLDFMTPGALNPALTFTRASTGTYFDNTGTMQTASANAPRWDYDPTTLALRGMLIEEARTNLFLNSATLVTQNVTITAQVYTLSFYGTGTITYSGVASGPLIGAGAFPQRASVSFTPTAGTLTCTVTGSVLNAQIEAGAMASSWIPTVGAAATRSADLCSMPVGAWFSASASSLAVDYMLRQSPNPSGGLRFATVINDGGATNRIALIAQTASSATSLVSTVVASATSNTPGLGAGSANAVTKLAGAWGGGSASGALNGGSVQTVAVGVPSGLTTLAIGQNSVGLYVNGHIRRVRYWNQALAPADLQAVTA